MVCNVGSTVYIYIFISIYLNHVTLTISLGFNRGWNPLFLSHHWKGPMYSKPNDITLAAAATRPSSTWHCWMEISWPNLRLPTMVRMESIRAGDSCARILVESQTTWETVLWLGDSTVFSCDSKSNMNSWDERGRHHQYNLAHRFLGVTKEPELRPCTLVKVWGDKVRPNGGTRF